MVAVDTNIIVRLLTRDDEIQYQKALQVINNQEIYIPETVILETEWVLRYAYKFKIQDICNALKGLLGLHNMHISNPHTIAQAIEWHSSGLDFSDALHLANSQECEFLYSFDEKFAKRTNEFSKCAVLLP